MNVHIIVSIKLSFKAISLREDKTSLFSLYIYFLHRPALSWGYLGTDPELETLVYGGHCVHGLQQRRVTVHGRK